MDHCTLFRENVGPLVESPSTPWAVPRVGNLPPKDALDWNRQRVVHRFRIKYGDFEWQGYFLYHPCREFRGH